MGSGSLASEKNWVVTFVQRGIGPAIKPLLDETWRGLENVPRRGGAVIAANHLSYVDPFVWGRFLIFGAGRYPHYLGKAELFAIPVIGRFLVKAQQVPVYRGSSDAADSFTAAVQAVERGEAICILPEGTITRDPNQWPMTGKTGAAKVALVSGCPLIPVAMWGNWAMIPGHNASLPVLARLVTRRHPVTVAAGPAVDLDDLRGKPLTSEILQEATARLMAAITGLVAELRDEQPPSEPFENPKVVSRKVKRRPKR